MQAHGDIMSHMQAHGDIMSHMQAHGNIMSHMQAHGDIMSHIRCLAIPYLNCNIINKASWHYIELFVLVICSPDVISVYHRGCRSCFNIIATIRAAEICVYCSLLMRQKDQQVQYSALVKFRGNKGMHHSFIGKFCKVLTHFS